MSAIQSYRIDSLRNGQSDSRPYPAAMETEARQWFNYMADTGHECELVAIDDLGRTHLLDEYKP